MINCFKSYRNYLILFFSLTLGLSSGYSQSVDSVFIIKVKKPKSEFIVTYQDTFLIKGKEHIFGIGFKKGKKEIAYVKSDSLRVKKITKNFFSILPDRNTTINKAMIKVFARYEDGKIRLYKVLTYQVIEPEMPQIYVGDVKADSLIDKRYLYDYAKLNAIYKGVKIRVLSFQLEIEEQVYTSSNNLLTISMKNTIQKLEPGSLLYFKNIVCLLPNGTIETVKLVPLFFDTTDKYKIGERTLYKN